jgi:hypothetical protein
VCPVNIVTALFSLGLVVKRPTLTEEEREAIVTALAFLRGETDEPGVAQDAATLGGLLERTR